MGKDVRQLIKYRNELREAIAETELELQEVNKELYALTNKDGTTEYVDGVLYSLKQIVPERTILNEAGLKKKYGDRFESLFTRRVFDTKMFEHAIKDGEIPRGDIKEFVSKEPLTGYVKVTVVKEKKVSDE